MKTIIHLIAIVIFVLVLSGCPEKGYDYTYDTLIENKTNDTLTFIIGKENNNISQIFNQFTLLPLDTLNGWENRFGAMSFNNGTDPVQFFFERIKPYPFDTVLIYRHDTLKTIWSFPNFRGPCTEHSFFNYNSWKTWITDSETGKIMFTIYPSDLTLNKK